MAWYSIATLRYRGRLIAVTERYGSFHHASVEKGKPLMLTRHDLYKIKRLSLRGEARRVLDDQNEGYNYLAELSASAME